MKLLLSILLASLLGLLIFLGPVGWFLLGAIIVGVLFRSLFLLNDIHKRLSTITKTPDKVEEAYNTYMNESKTH
ncbi:hypothetical protein [Halalkalibacter akibai]|uniref:ATP-dependent Lon protease n=1 Tax=Halalkalibacter akibai (strain ATCC 43226 / DSM 21942 / CIP 109018 / JCM 9157 / 1139) TaxID=1236973 RepID=W4QVP6_HALA3|nr:hypothetical protein [Halalkalibacter akibai]GAE35952.1 hypothetical protein JCM9157_3095 [Halalkalibacter akibai JCM 9157]